MGKTNTVICRFRSRHDLRFFEKHVSTSVFCVHQGQKSVQKVQNMLYWPLLLSKNPSASHQAGAEATRTRPRSMIGGPMKPTNIGRGSGTFTWRSRKQNRIRVEKKRKQQRAIRKRRLRLHNPFGGRSLLARPFQSFLTSKYLFPQRCLSALASRTSVDFGNNTLFLVKESWIFDQERSSYMAVILPIRYVSDKEEKT